MVMADREAAVAAASSNAFGEKIPIKFDDGTTRNLYFDFNSFVELEERTGRQLLNGELFNMKSAKDIRLLLYVGLIHEAPDLTPHDVGKLINMRNIHAIEKAIRQAIDGAMPDEDESAEDGQGNVTQTQAIGTGSERGRKPEPSYISARRNSGR